MLETVTLQTLFATVGNSLGGGCRRAEARRAKRAGGFLRRRREKFWDVCLSKGNFDDFEPQEEPPTHLKSHLFKPYPTPKQGPPSLKLGTHLSHTSL